MSERKPQRIWEREVADADGDAICLDAYDDGEIEIECFRSVIIGPGNRVAFALAVRDAYAAVGVDLAGLLDRAAMAGQAEGGGPGA